MLNQWVVVVVVVLVFGSWGWVGEWRSKLKLEVEERVKLVWRMGEERERESWYGEGRK